MGSTFTVDDETREVLERAIVEEVEGQFWLRLPNQLDRDLYQRVDKVLRAAGGRWNRRERGHVFQEDPRTLLAAAKEEGIATNVQQRDQAFYTPADVVTMLCDLAHLFKGQYVLEPSAGDGRIAVEMRNRGCKVVVCELNTARRRALMGQGFSCLGTDFLATKPAVLFDRVVMNPPFTKGQDIDHVRHAYEHCLAPSGRLVAIMSPAYSFATAKRAREFRALLADLDTSVVALPDGTFKESGTNARAVILVINKPEPA